MGCGSSTLKGDKVEDVAAEPPKPVKRVQTNFSDVDFTGESGQNRRGTVALAPDEQRRPTKTSEVLDTAPDAQPITTIKEEPAQEAYDPTATETEQPGSSNHNAVKDTPAHSDDIKSSETTNLDSNTANGPATTANTNSTSTAVASAPDPSESTTLAEPNDEPRRKSWFDRFSVSHKDKSPEISQA